MAPADAVDVCAYRLFSETETHEETLAAWKKDIDTQRRLDYSFTIDLRAGEMFLIEFDELTGTISTPVDVSTRLNKKNKFSLSYHQYGHTGVYLVAKKADGSSANLDFTMEYAVR